MNRLAIAFAFFLLPGCTSTLALSIAPGESLHVVHGANEWQLNSSDARYQQLQRWLAHNQAGWSQPYATNPNGGILVSGSTLHLQFIGSAVFAITGKGMFTKSVKKSDYAFLIARPST